MQQALCGANNIVLATASPIGSASAYSARFQPAAPRPGRRSLSMGQTFAALSRREVLGGSAAAVVAVGAQGASGSGATVGAMAAAPAAPEANVQLRDLRTEKDAFGVERLALQPEGWNTWKWRGHKVNWLAAGDSGPVVLLIHGFGASVYHWRYNVPELAKSCRVFAIDCLGFGWSSKPLVEYNGYSLWTDQIADFVREVVPGNDKAVLVGNSLGGYNALATAARHPELVRGVVLVNAAGRFEEGAAANKTEVATSAQQNLWTGLVEKASSVMKRGMVKASFIFTKQPARIRQVLGQVYVSPDHIDDDLVRSIALPAQDPNAAEVFYRIITAQGEAMNRLLDRLRPAKMPVYLLWGEKDPWCVPARATQIQRYYPSAERTDINSGHCPHDDSPELVNTNLLRWVSQLPEKTA